MDVNNPLKNLMERFQNLVKGYGLEWKNSYLRWDIPSNVTADLSINVLLIVHKTNLDIEEVYKQIVDSLVELDIDIKLTTTGYINISFPNSWYYEFAKNVYDSAGKNLQGAEKKTVINIEYGSANPTGDLHLANLRQCFFGNSLVRLYRFQGYRVVAEYYINDRGNQINDLLHSVYHHYRLLLNATVDDSEDVKYDTTSSKEAAEHFVKKWGDKYLDEKEYKEAKEVLRSEAVSFILDRIKKDLDICGVYYDKWTSEKRLYGGDSLQKALESLEKRGLTYWRDSALFLKTTLTGDDKDRVMIKSDGEYTYFLSDILYHLDKFTRSEKVINLWGADHHGYVSRLLGVCSLIANPGQSAEVIIVQMVNLITNEGKKTKFSKRSGNVIGLKEALTYIDKDQLNFLCLEKEPNQQLNIDVDLLKKKQKNTPLYTIQYANARCHQIIKKACLIFQGEKSDEWKIKKCDEFGLLGKNEKKILTTLMRFSFVLEDCVYYNRSHLLLYYLIELTKEWNIYYQNYPVLNADNLKLTGQKLLMIEVVKIVLTKGMEILGVSVPESM